MLGKEILSKTMKKGRKFELAKVDALPGTSSKQTFPHGSLRKDQYFVGF